MPVHYKKGGNWSEIDTTLVKSGKKNYKTKATGLSIRVTRKANKKSVVSMKRGRTSLSVALKGKNYQPAAGRFLTRDTYTGEEDEPQSLHLYTYCYNNPVSYLDRGGNSPIADFFNSAYNWFTNYKANDKESSHVMPNPTTMPKPIGPRPKPKKRI